MTFYIPCDKKNLVNIVVVYPPTQKGMVLRPWMNARRVPYEAHWSVVGYASEGSALRSMWRSRGLQPVGAPPKQEEWAEGDHKPSSVSLFCLACLPRTMLGSGPAGWQGWNWDDGHLSRILIAQDLKRPYPSRLCTSVLHRAKCKRAAHIPCIVQRRRGLFGLAPGGVYPATLITQGTGELLPHLFTLTHRGSRLRVRS